MILRIIELIVLIAFVFSIPVIIFFQSHLYYWWDYVESLVENDPSTYTYDFIVVGAGTAGSVVANRLSKNSKVLVLEAGGNPLSPGNIPLLLTEMLKVPHVTRIYKSIPQKFSCFAMENHQAGWPRGIVLGGTSSVNGIFYVRRHQLDFDLWANLTSDESWNYENVLKYFKKSMRYDGNFAETEKEYGENPYGFLHVERKKSRELYSLVKHGMEQLGYQEIDINGQQKTGFSIAETTSKSGSRVSTYTAFIEPILHRDNLRILRYATATKIKIDPSGQAKGVWYSRHGKKYFARASKEIIVSAGVMESPKLLMLSGVGPRKELEDIGITVKADLPVGKNLKDHIAFFLFPFNIEKPITFVPERDFGLKTLWDYFYRGKGPLTSPSLMNAVAFISSSLAKKSHADWPDIELYFGFWGTYSKDFAKELSYFTGVNQTHLEAYLQNSQGIKTAVNLMESTNAYKKLNSTFTKAQFPGCEHHKIKSDQYYECYARHLGITSFHPVGTCKMGKGINDPTAVVDSKLRVLKIHGVRVVDASIMPEIVNGNTQAPTIMIGEKAADLIREHWSTQNAVCDKIMGIFCKSTEQSKCFYPRLF